MKNILRIDSSLFSEKGVSNALMDHLVEKLKDKYKLNQLVTRDLVEDAIPHLDATWIQALMMDEDTRTNEQKEKVAYSDGIIEEVEQADILVLALPMYNFSVPSVVKAWFDHLARAGRTFKYTDAGPEGLLTGKKTYLVTTRGGVHRNKETDTLIPFALNFLRFVGLGDVEVIYAEGLNLSGDSRQKGIDEARNNIQSLIAA